ncbi:serine hydrolase [Candidatus Kaiserbacteria bacterium]|nr:serine hydrolase [Candidatus Kaiserbacteria bacterium]
MKYVRKYWHVILILAIGVVLGYGAAFLNLNWRERNFLNSSYPLRANDESFRFVHALVAYETPQATVLPEYAELKRKVETLIHEKLQDGTAESISVYYRDTEASRWIGVNEDTAYYPASLLKVPLMIAYFKAEESDPSLLQRKIVYVPISVGDKYEAPSQLTSGRSYTIQELIEKMIIDSDNGATFTLVNRIDPDLLASVYRRLGITDPGDDSATYRIPTETYALFFRTLFNGTYLTPSASERALEILSRTTYKDGLAAGIPEGIVVSHKYGEHVAQKDGAPVGEELHDCGIIYKPDHPYLLCVMTRAKTLDAAKSVIKTISELVYSHLST